MRGIVKIPDAYLWRPSAEMSTLEESLTSIVAWLAEKVILGVNDLTSATLFQVQYKELFYLN